MSGDGQNYKDFYSAMIKFLMVGSHPGDSYHSGPVDGAVVKHSFNLAWRILDCLPPSVDFFQKLLQDLERQHLQVTVSKVIDIDSDKLIVTVIVLVLSPVTLRSNHTINFASNICTVSNKARPVVRDLIKFNTRISKCFSHLFLSIPFPFY